MAFTKGLYYPTIEIQNENWLKNASFYWDEISTIVPESLRNPYRSRVSKELVDAGILVPFNISPTNSIVRGISSQAVNYLNSMDAQKFILSRTSGYQIHRDKLSKGFEIHIDKLPELFKIHKDKLPYLIEDDLRSGLYNGDWFVADSGFAQFYMSLLANKICENKGLALLTDDSFASNFY
jgi:hypothetical protein